MREEHFCRTWKQHLLDGNQIDRHFPATTRFPNVLKQTQNGLNVLIWAWFIMAGRPRGSRVAGEKAHPESAEPATSMFLMEDSCSREGLAPPFQKRACQCA